MHFIDETEIKVQAGNGGNGIVSFHRAAFVPKGGPDGGNGGKGGDVIITASSQMGTLEEVSQNRVYKAGNGKPGQGSRKSGKGGKNINIKVPTGTIIYDAHTGIPLVDLAEDKETFVAAAGGGGGCGNSRYKSARNRTPRRADNGKPGEVKNLRLELKLIADVGLVGKPNAGKSTLLAALTAAKPFIADYPFSTLSPALGIFLTDAYQKITVADIPGLVEDAGKGKGLGRRFLKHIERTRLMVVLIEAPENNYEDCYKTLMSEVDGFSAELKHSPRLVVMSKIDLSKAGEDADTFGFDCEVSGRTGEGLDRLKEMIVERLSIAEEIVT